MLLQVIIDSQLRMTHLGSDWLPLQTVCMEFWLVYPP